MNKCIPLFFSILLSLFFLSSCHEDKDEFIPDGDFEYVGNINSLKNTLSPPYETHTLHLENSLKTYPINHISSLKAGAENFFNSDGEHYTGEFSFSIKHSETTSEWIGLNYNFKTESGYLDAHYVQKISFRDADGRHLTINSDNPPVIRLEFELEVKEPRIFKLESSSGKWSTHSDILPFTYWEKEDANGEIVEVSGYEFEVSNKLLYAIGHEFMLEPEVKVCVQLPKGFTSSNTTTYVVFKNHNTLINLNHWDNKNKYLACNNILKLPANEFVDVVSISGLSGNRYFFDSRVNYLDESEEQLFDLDPVKKNLSTILNRLNLAE